MRSSTLSVCVFVSRITQRGQTISMSFSGRIALGTKKTWSISGVIPLSGTWKKTDLDLWIVTYTTFGDICALPSGFSVICISLRMLSLALRRNVARASNW